MKHSISSLSGDLRVSFVDAYVDGTIHASIEDESGRGVVVCIDGREGSTTRYRLFQGARHPKMPEAKLIELGAVEEGLVIPLISRWIDSDEARGLFTPDGHEILQSVLIRLGGAT
jgi:hypothetical protein